MLLTSVFYCHTVCIAGVLPVRDALTATAWAERPAGGQPGWGVGLFSTPDAEGFEAGLVLGKPSTQHAACRCVKVLRCRGFEV
jgi:hypothetical protein